jgi:acetolactate synthase-1/2/3 large subunit
MSTTTQGSAKPDTAAKATANQPRAARGCEIVIDALEREDADTVFGFPGGAILDIFDQLNRSQKIRFILVRHEQGAMHMAEGYARSTGKVGVVLVTSGPGATNTVTGLANALMDSTPLVVISGQVPTALIGNDAFQEADVVGITRPVTKHNYLVKSIRELPQILRNAFHIAQTGRPGPVVVDIPKDIQKATLENYAYPDEPDLPSYRVQVSASPERIMEAWDLIRNSKRPLIYAGGGVINANAADDLFLFATRANIPVTTTLMGLGAFPETHPLALLMLGMHGTIYANKAVQACDVLIAAGARFDDRVTGKTSEFAPHAKIIHVDIDPSSISKNVTVDVDLLGDVRHILRDLNKLVERCDTEEWLEQVQAWKKQHPLLYNDCQGEEIKPQYLIQTIDRLAPDDAIIASEVGQHQMWTAQYYTFTRPRTFVTSGGLGTMGFGFPASIGAQAGNPGRVVIDIAGDGSLQMTIQELATAVYNHLPVKVVIVNNGWLGMVRQWQDLFYRKNYSATELARAEPGSRLKATSPGSWTNAEYLPDFARLAEAYGAWGRRVTSRSELEPVLREAFANDRPCLVDVRVTREENVFPMVPAGASLNQMLEGMA